MNTPLKPYGKNPGPSVQLAPLALNIPTTTTHAIIMRFKTVNIRLNVLDT